MRNSKKQSSTLATNPNTSRNNIVPEKFAYDDESDKNGSQPSSEKEMQSVSVPKQRSRKRQYSPESDEDLDVGASGENDPQFGNEMQKMLESFGADISKTLVNKRKRLEQFTSSSIKTSNRKIEDIWKSQQHQRNKLREEYTKQTTAVYSQWESDVEKMKEHEERLLNMMKQQQKFFQQMRLVQNQRLKAVKQLHDQFVKSVEELENTHADQQSNVQAELKKEMAHLQKRILMDTQQQEMANVRKSLQTMLF